MARETLRDVFEDLARASGAFLVHDDGLRRRSFAYADVAAASRRLAARLAACDVAKGDRVVLAGEHGPEWIVGFWACVLRGLVVVPVDARTPADVLRQVAPAVDARLVLAARDASIGRLPAGLVTWRLAGLLGPGVGLEAVAPPAPVEIAPDDVAEIRVASSRTTAVATGSFVTHRDLLSTLDAFQSRVDGGRAHRGQWRGTRVLNLLPLTDPLGLVQAACLPPKDGTVVLTRRPTPGTIVRLLRTHRIDRIVTGQKTANDLAAHLRATFPRLGLEVLEVPRTTGSDAVVLAVRGSSRHPASRPASPPSDRPDRDAMVVRFPTWTRSRVARVVRRLGQITWVLPLGRYFARAEVHGFEHVAGLTAPVIFASNHQSVFDTPAILASLPSRWRSRTAVALATEFFGAHFQAGRHGLFARIRGSAAYYFVALFFNAFPLPPTPGGTSRVLRYVGSLADAGDALLIFPEGLRTDVGEINAFRPGIGMMADRLHLAVVPVRIEGFDRVLHRLDRRPRRGRVRVAFGPALILAGDDPLALTAQVEAAVRALLPEVPIPPAPATRREA